MPEKEKWITINGRHVQIDSDGDIIKGGSGMGISNVNEGNKNHSNVTVSDLYSILSEEYDKNGSDDVIKLAIEIFNEKPELKNNLIKELYDLGISLPVELRKENKTIAVKKEDNKDNKDNKYNIDIKSLKEGSQEWAEAAYVQRVIPDGWAVHGRRKRQDLDTGNVIQLSYSWEVAEQYSGAENHNNGSQWLVKPSKDSKVFNLESENSKDMDKIIKRAMIDYHNGTLPFSDDLDNISDNPTDDEIIAAIRKSFSPGNIVDSAGAYDNIEWVKWLSNIVGVDFVYTPDGAVSLKGSENIDKVKVPNSEAQERAMQAAAHGNSKIGIPESVGKEFTKSDSVIKKDLSAEMPESSITGESVAPNELDIARMMSYGSLQSPQKYENLTLFDIRITGTGAAYRPQLKEFTYRDPDIYLNDYFLARCNGLPVIWIHPPNILNSEEYIKRNIGTVFLPYIKDNEVWAIAKIFDDEAIKLMVQSQMSTSPGIKLAAGSGEKLELGDGKDHLLVEGRPSLVDHIAIVENGVWDKMNDPTGVRLDSTTTEVTKMPNEEKELKTDTGADPVDFNKTILDALGKISERMDATDKRFDAFEKSKNDVAADKEKEAEEKNDAEKVETQRRLDAVEERLKSDDSDTETAAMNDAQYKFDSVLQLHSKKAPRPMLGEKVNSYRLRVLKTMQEFSDNLKNVDLSKIADPAAFSYMESQIINDATSAANDVTKIAKSLPRGQLREVKKQYGRVEAVEFVGDPSACWDAFKQPVGVGRIIKQNTFNN